MAHAIPHARLNRLVGHLKFEHVSYLHSHPTNGARPNRFQDKVVIVTGAASGFGREVSFLVAEEGGSVFCVDWNEEGVKETVRLTKQAGGKAEWMKADVADENASRLIVERCIEVFGTLDAYFANAGVVGSVLKSEHITAANFERTFRVNTLGCFLALKFGSQALQKLGKAGSIVCTASVAGLNSGAGGVDYSSSKAAVINLCKTMAWELTGSGVRCNAICPGLVETGMTKGLFDMARSRGTAGKIGQLNPTQRGGTVREVANTAAFLLSDESSYVNGQALAVCGGLSASLPIVPPRVRKANESAR